MQTNEAEIKIIFQNFEDISVDFKFNQLTSGHINETYWVYNNGCELVLQKLNRIVFNNLNQISQNISEVATYLSQKEYPHQILRPIPFKDGSLLCKKQWRLFPFFKNSQTFEKVQSTDQAFKAAQFLSEFHAYLKHFPTGKIYDSIDGFLDFKLRYTQFKRALQSASENRLTKAREEIIFIKKHKDLLKTWLDLVPKMPKRLIHADPKISNFLFERQSKTKIKALIDWDTLMCGSILYDFGDMVRSYTNLRKEDDPESGMNFSLDNYVALKKGFFYHLKDELVEAEIQNMELAGQVVIYVQAIRFLTDYLHKDVYYNTDYPKHNLHRAQNQINLLRELQKNF